MWINCLLKLKFFIMCVMVVVLDSMIIYSYYVIFYNYISSTIYDGIFFMYDCVLNILFTDLEKKY